MAEKLALVATATAALSLGAIPVFADVEPDAYALDARCAEAAIAERTRATVAVHIGGCPADLDFIFRHDPAAFGGRDRSSFLEALRAEGVPCSPGYVPLHHSPAIREETARLHRALGRHQSPPPTEARLPLAERAGYAEGAWLTRNLLLAEPADLEDVVAAAAKNQGAE